jgi:hypothetical protein
MEFSIEEASGLRRIAADFRFLRKRSVTVDGERFDFERGELLRLFFSYRYTPERAGRLLKARRLEILGQWITKSEEEGVFLCRKSAGG